MSKRKDDDWREELRTYKVGQKTIVKGKKKDRREKKELNKWRRSLDHLMQLIIYTKTGIRRESSKQIFQHFPSPSIIRYPYKMQR
jgi:hypothetical protein